MTGLASRIHSSRDRVGFMPGTRQILMNIHVLVERLRDSRRQKRYVLWQLKQQAVVHITRKLIPFRKLPPLESTVYKLWRAFFIESGTHFLLQTQEGRFPALYLCCRGSFPLWPFDSHLKLYSLLPKKRKEKSRQSSRDTITFRQ